MDRTILPLGLYDPRGEREYLPLVHRQISPRSRISRFRFIYDKVAAASPASLLLWFGEVVERREERALVVVSRVFSTRVGVYGPPRERVAAAGCARRGCRRARGWFSTRGES